MAYQTLETEREGSILRVWMNRPDRLNAINQLVLREIGDLFLGLETDFETRVVVLGGRGRTFCAGMDRKKPEPGQEDIIPSSERERRWIAQLGRRACRAIEDCEIPTIARWSAKSKYRRSCATGSARLTATTITTLTPKSNADCHLTIRHPTGRRKLPRQKNHR